MLHTFEDELCNQSDCLQMGGCCYWPIVVTTLTIRFQFRFATGAGRESGRAPVGLDRDVPGAGALGVRQRQRSVRARRENRVSILVLRLVDLLHQLDDPVCAGDLRNGARPNGGDATVTTETGSRAYSIRCPIRLGITCFICLYSGITRPRLGDGSGRNARTAANGSINACNLKVPAAAN